VEHQLVLEPALDGETLPVPCDLRAPFELDDRLEGDRQPRQRQPEKGGVLRRNDACGIGLRTGEEGADSIPHYARIRGQTRVLAEEVLEQPVHERAALPRVHFEARHFARNEAEIAASEELERTGRQLLDRGRGSRPPVDATGTVRFLRVEATDPWARQGASRLAARREAGVRRASPLDGR